LKLGGKIFGSVPASTVSNILSLSLSLFRYFLENESEKTACILVSSVKFIRGVMEDPRYHRKNGAGARYFDYKSTSSAKKPDVNSSVLVKRLDFK
jgi:hypothetical protein